MATYEHLLVEERDAVAWATLNRPERLNALNGLLIAELKAFFGRLSDIMLAMRRCPSR